jgi:hypothetical protein
MTEAAEARVNNKGLFIKDIFESSEWWDAVSRCSNFLKADLMPYSSIPLMPLGTPPLQHFMQNVKIYISKNRGLRRRTKDGRILYPTWNPASIHHRGYVSEQERMTKELFSDIRNTAEILLGTGQPKPVQYAVYEDVEDIIGLLDWGANHPGPWAFDIETYDSKLFPSREEVATDPCHPDFCVRGIGIAWDADTGSFIDLKQFQHLKGKLRPYLTRLFSSPAPKWAANGHFDEEGLVYTGWIPEVHNRAGDSMLAMIAASGGQLAGFSLERGIVDVLHEFYHWADIQKSHMRELDTAIVADGCVRDAAGTWRLCNYIHYLMERGEYLP